MLSTNFKLPKCLKYHLLKKNFPFKNSILKILLVKQIKKIWKGI